MRIPAIIIARLGLIVVCMALGWLSYQDYQHAQVTIGWTTASELNTIGFNIYRSSQPDSPRTQINRELIPSSPDPLIGGEYSIIDSNVQPGFVYYYWLEDVEDTGNASIHGPKEVMAKGKVSFTALGFGLAAGFLILSLLYSPRKRVENPTN